MGDWTYYVVKMTMRELADNVKFASQVYEDRTLDEAIQRVLNEPRVKKEIVTYLKRQPFRFFSSIVVAAVEGDPTFYPVEITDDPRFAVFRDDRRLNDAFGVLRFDGEQNYYALDGQHRLAAIKTVLDTSDPLSEGAPPEIGRDEISVIVVVPKPGESGESFMQRYRRLFSNLNRYAKPMDQATNIIMDEDDAFAILTRRLITDHDFFKSPGRQRESRKIKTDRGKNLRTTDAYFTSIETLYDLNRSLLTSRERQNHGWTNDLGSEKTDEFIRFRPDDDILDNLYDELAIYWDGILAEIPDLQADPTTMRVHSLKDDELEGDSHDHILFWPIGQEMLASVVRDLLDDRLVDPGNPDPTSVREAIEGLGSLDWELHRPPWRHFFLVQDETGGWRMRSEERTAVRRLGGRIVLWLLGEELDSEQLDDLRQQWAIRLVPNQNLQAEDRMWEQTESQRIS